MVAPVFFYIAAGPSSLNDIEINFFYKLILFVNYIIRSVLTDVFVILNFVFHN